MLYEFLTENRIELINRCRDKAAARAGSSVPPSTDGNGVPLFLQQLADTLRAEHRALHGPGDQAGQTPAAAAISSSAALHGGELLRRGLSVDQVVHEYGDVCQAVTELAVEKKIPLTNDEFRTLNRCLDDAIADAVTAFGASRERVSNERAESLRVLLTRFVEEHRRLLDVATAAYAVIKRGDVGVSGATATLLMNTLAELHFAVERALPEIHMANAVTTLAAD
ncbi:MAG: hypothetical protein ABJB01_03035 [Rudaea sp.]